MDRVPSIVGWAVHNQVMTNSEKRNAFFVVKSAEGRRSSLHRTITAEKRTAQRNALEKAGIRRIRPAIPR